MFQKLADKVGSSHCHSRGSGNLVFLEFSGFRWRSDWQLGRNDAEAGIFIGDMRRTRAKNTLSFGAFFD
jgi:hypothetical protein